MDLNFVVRYLSMAYHPYRHRKNVVVTLVKIIVSMNNSDQQGHDVVHWAHET